MQPYFDPTRKTTSKKMEDNIKQMRKKMEDDLNKNENGRRTQFFFEKVEWRPPIKMEENLKKNGRQPQKKKMEDDLKQRSNQPKST